MNFASSNTEVVLYDAEQDAEILVLSVVFPGQHFVEEQPEEIDEKNPIVENCSSALEDLEAKLALINQMEEQIDMPAFDSHRKSEVDREAQEIKNDLLKS